MDHHQMIRQNLDLVLVPSGLALLLAYHVWLIYHTLKHPTKTVMGINAINRRIWVQTMRKDPASTGVLAVQTLRNNIMASTLLATMAVMLSSLVAVVMTSTGGMMAIPHQEFIYGNTSQLSLSVKFFAVLVCFLLAFLFDLQSIRYYSHASILINVSTKNSNQITVDYVAGALNRGGFFWSLGLRAFYFSFPLFFWIFGPVPMFVCCIVLLGMLFFLDLSFVVEMAGKEEEGENGWVVPV